MRTQPAAPPKVPTAREPMRGRNALPSLHLHESWLDDLYWDVERER